MDRSHGGDVGVRQGTHHDSSPRSDPASVSAARWAVLSIVAVTVLQLIFLSIGCDWDLCGDEAEFWAWSRRLDWSYYARGPLIAVVIRLATALAGPAAGALTGSQAAAVRLSAVLLGALTAWGLYRLTEETCRSRRAAVLAVLLVPAVPLFRLGGLLMTCDTPLVCCWTWAAVWSYRAVTGGRRSGWPAAGVLVALGVLAKYTMLAFPASVALFLLLRPAHRRHLIGPGFWVMAAGAALGMAPILAWNAQHAWVAADQMADRVGLTSAWNWGRLQPLFGFLAGEALVLGVWWPFAFGGLVAAVRRLLGPVRPGPAPGATRAAEPDVRTGLLYLVCLWGVVWLACVAVSLLGESEANWAAPGYVSLLALLGWWVDLRLGRVGAASGPTKRFAWGVGGVWILALAFLTALQHTEWFYPALARALPAPTAGRPAPLRSYDPTCRLRGYRELAPEVSRRLAALRAEGLDPFVLAPTYTLASSLSFYLPGQPEVYCLSWSPGMAARVLNQHDLWRPNPRLDRDVFGGRPAVVVDDANMPSYARAIVQLGLFQRADPASRLDVRRRGAVVAAWNVTVCRDYRGPAHADEIRSLLARYSSARYFAEQGGTPEAYLRSLYRDLVGRAPSDAELRSWSSLLAAQPRTNVVAKMVASPEVRRHLWR